MFDIDDLNKKIIADKKVIEELNEEIRELLKDDKVNRYINLQNELYATENSIKYNKTMLQIETQRICEHKLVCFKSIFFKSLKYNPEFECLNCGKRLAGYLDDDQICINEHYVYENEVGMFYEKQKYIQIKYRFNKLKEQGLSIDEIGDILQEEFKDKNDEPVKMKIRKRDIN